MSEEFQAIYEQGVLRLDQPLTLPDHSRVSGIVVALTSSTPSSSAEDFDRELEALSMDVPLLPEDFSRADIYMDHD
jgi:hypothetical protein